MFGIQEGEEPRTDWVVSQTALSITSPVKMEKDRSGTCLKEGNQREVRVHSWGRLTGRVRGACFARGQLGCHTIEFIVSSNLLARERGHLHSRLQTSARNQVSISDPPKSRRNARLTFPAGWVTL